MLVMMVMMMVMEMVMVMVMVMFMVTGMVMVMVMVMNKVHPVRPAIYTLVQSSLLSMFVLRQNSCMCR